MAKKPPPQRQLRMLAPEQLLQNVVTVLVHLVDRYHADPMVADALQALKDHFALTNPPPPSGAAEGEE